MKRIFYLTFLFLVNIPFSGYSQIMDLKFQAFYDDFEQLKRFNEAPEKTYDGSPYLTDAFQPGTILLDNGREYTDILLRYNIYNDLFEFSKDDKALTINRDPQFARFRFEDRVFVFKTFKFRDQDADGYLELLVEGNYSLYLKHFTVLRDGEEAGAYQEATKPTFYPQKPVFMIGDPDNNIIDIKGSKDLLNKFDSIKEPVEQFTGKKKLKLKSEKDFIDLVNYLNSKS